MNELCLVTGGAGFIGSHLVEGLTAAGQRVRVLDNFSTGLRDNLSGVRPVPEIIEADLTDADAVAAATQGVSVIYHLGAIASVQRGLEDPPLMHHVCAGGTMNVLDAARRAAVRRVVYAASASAYGMPTKDVQNEDDAICPLSTYAAAKLAGEMYCQAFAASHGLQTVRLRFFNIFGPRQRPDSPYSGVIALFIAAMSAGRPPTIFGDGLQSRDFTDVRDVVQAMMKAAAAPPEVSGRVYNIGTGRSVSILDLVASLNRLLGAGLTPVQGPTRTGDVRHSRADISRARQDLGYEPAVPFEEGLRRTLDWCRAQGQ